MKEFVKITHTITWTQGEASGLQTVSSEEEMKKFVRELRERGIQPVVYKKK